MNRRLKRLAEKLVGADLGDFFDVAIRGTDDLPLENLLATLGLNVGWRPTESRNDQGGKVSKAKTIQPSTGMRIKEHVQRVSPLLM